MAWTTAALFDKCRAGSSAEMETQLAFDTNEHTRFHFDTNEHILWFTMVYYGLLQFTMVYYGFVGMIMGEYCDIDGVLPSGYSK